MYDYYLLVAFIIILITTIVCISIFILYNYTDDMSDGTIATGWNIKE